MTTRQQQLLALVLEDPSREHCAAYAEHLRELGDERAELITTDIAIEVATDARERKSLRALRHALLQKHADTWWPWGYQLRGSGSQLPITRRGFIEAVWLSQWNVDNGGVLAALTHEPIRHVDLCDTSDKLIAALVSAPGRVERLDVPTITTDSLATLGGWSGLAKLRELQFSSLHNVILTPGLFAAVEDLQIWGQYDIEALTQWRRLTELTKLRLGFLFDPEDISRLFARGTFARLEELSLHSSRFHDGCAARLAAHAEALPALRELYVWSKGLGETGRRALRSAFPEVHIRL